MQAADRRGVMLYGWMKSLVLYLIMSGLVLNMAPSGNYRKYISFFAGLLIVIIMVRPLSFLLKFNTEDLERLVYGMESYMQDKSIFKDRDDIYDYYDMGVKTTIITSLKNMGYDIEDVNVITDKDKKPVSVTLYIKGNLTDTETDIVKKYIFEVYYVDVDSINIVRR